MTGKVKYSLTIILFIITVFCSYAQNSSIRTKIHYVKRGETLESISKAYYVSEEDIKNANPGRTTTLRMGQSLKIPGGQSSGSGSTTKTTVSKTTAKNDAGKKEIEIIDGLKYYVHKVSKGETLSRISSMYNVSVNDILGSTDVLQIGQPLKIPVDREKARAKRILAEKQMKADIRKEEKTETPEKKGNIKEAEVRSVSGQEKDAAVKADEKKEMIRAVSDERSSAVDKSFQSYYDEVDAEIGEVRKEMTGIKEDIAEMKEEVKETNALIEKLMKEIKKTGMEKNVADQATASEETSSLSEEPDSLADSPFDLGTDLMSRYVWRGTDFGRSSSVQSYLAWSAGNFEIGAWGAFTTNGFNYQETDLYISYTMADMFSLIITDYFFPDDDADNNNYFEYTDTLTGHIIELSAGFKGTDNIPFSLMAAVNVYGADAKKSNGDNAYSAYIELGYSGNCRGTDFDVFLGFTPNKADTDAGEAGFYADSPGIVNFGITAHKEIKISERYSLPVSCSLITNPQAENIFLVFGFSF